MFGNYFKGIEGVSIFPVIGLILFFGFFAGLLFLLYRTDNKFFKEMEVLPLDSSVSNTKGDENDK